MSETTTQYWATGRRKSSVAQVKMIKGSGKITVNKNILTDYFETESQRGYLKQPLVTASLEKDFDININVKGGGKVGQAGAVRRAIALALLKYNEDLRSSLKEAGLLTRDSRVKERKKPGRPGARKRFQFSKR